MRKMDLIVGVVGIPVLAGFFALLVVDHGFEMAVSSAALIGTAAVVGTALGRRRVNRRQRRR
jgi:hypothetical protein